MQVQCLKCKEPIEVKEANEFTRAYGVVCNKCRARYSEPPPNEIPPASVSSPESYEDASDLLTESSRNPPAMHAMAPPRLPPSPAPAAVEPRRVLPKAKPRVLTTAEEKRDPDEDIEAPPPSVGRIDDLRAMAAPPSSRHGRRVDDELVRLAGLSFVDAHELPQAPPATEEPATSVPCPHCGKRPEDPPAIGHALRRMRAALSAHPARSESPPAVPVGTPHTPDEARTDAAAPMPRPRPASLTPWAIAAASLVVAVVSIAARRDVPTTPAATAAPPPRAESTARVVERQDDGRGEAAGRPSEAANEALLDPLAKPKEPRAKAGAEPKVVPDDQAPRTKPTASAAAVSGAGKSFDRGAALAALSQAASQSGGCKKPGDPSGVAKINVTFAPSGKATNAQINGPPFAGTSTGSCLAKLFRSVTVPPFEGEPISASKTVSIR